MSLLGSYKGKDMLNASVMELETNMSFDVQIDCTPSEKQEMTTVFVDDKEVKRPSVTVSHGIIEFKALNTNIYIEKFLTKWFKTRKRIDLMLEADGHMYFMKGCSIKSFSTAFDSFTVFYNTFKEA